MVRIDCFEIYHISTNISTKFTTLARTVYQSFVFLLSEFFGSRAATVFG